MTIFTFPKTILSIMGLNQTKSKVDNKEINPDSFKRMVKNVDNHLWNLTNSVTCTICHDLYTEPVTTPCGHSFCSKCFKRVLCDNNTGGCPLCRHPVERRKIFNNNILHKLAQIWSEIPEAFKEDVTTIGSDMKELSADLVKSARILGISSAKERDNNSVKTCRRRGKIGSITEKDLHDGMSAKPASSHVSMTPSTVVNNNITIDLQSISQVDVNSQLYVEESLEVEKDLRKVKRVPSKQKVTDWLEKVNHHEVSPCKKRQSSASIAEIQPVKKGKCEDVKIKRTNAITSMARLDYPKSKKSNGVVKDNAAALGEKKAQEEQTTDPYEFVPSQRHGAQVPKKRSATKGRKKSKPKFESLQSFTKDSVKKAGMSAEKNPDPNSNASDELDENIFPSQEKLDSSLFRRTYSRRSKRNEKEETIAAAKDAAKVEHDRLRRVTSEESKPVSENHAPVADGHDEQLTTVKKGGVRRILLPTSDSRNGEKTEVDQIATKKPRLDLSVEVIAKRDGDESEAKLGSEMTNRCPQSPGWSRLSDLKKDFDSSDKRKVRTCLDVTGKMPTRVSNTDRVVVIRPSKGEEDCTKTHDPLNKNSELLIGFDSQAYTEKETDFKRMVARMEKELEEANVNVKSVSDDEPIPLTNANSYAKESNNKEEEYGLLEDGEARLERSKSPNLALLKEKKPVQVKLPKTGNRKTIPFSLLGKIKNRRKSSAVFLQLGHLSRNSKRTVVKLVLPKYCHRREKKVTQPSSIIASTQTDSLVLNNKAIGTTPVTTADAETQTSDHLSSRMETKEVQTSINQKSVNLQTDALTEDESAEKQQVTSLPSQIFEELNNYDKDVLKMDGVERIVGCSGKDGSAWTERDFQVKKVVGEVETQSGATEFNTELQCEMNKSWTAVTQVTRKDGGELKEEVNPSEIGKGEDEIVNLNTSSNESSNVLMNRVIDNINLDMERARKISSKTFPEKRNVDNCEESDSDIFIEQTPPKNISLSRTGRDGDGEDEVVIAANGSEESVLFLSECQDGDVTEKTLAVQKSVTPRGDSDEIKQSCMNSPQSKGNTTTRDDGEFKMPQNPVPQRICLVSSGINNRKNLDKFINRFRVEHSSCSKKEMTHLVVGLHENEDGDMVPHCTPKVLYAIANKKWVVTEEWIEACLKADAILPEASYESVDPGGGNGCNAARLSTDHLLKNCEVFLLGEYEGITKDEFAVLITDCGGTIVNHPRQFSLLSGRIRMILADGSGLDEEQEKSMKELMVKCRTAVMSRDVVIVSIQNYRLTNFAPYLLHPMCSDKLVKWGYPYELVKSESGDSGKNGSNA